ncbi:hypothetical protein, partial [Actinoalloteichus spitiensis]|uniref:hypothetical protein n=1 Tax=Actinoalloteichus spitiensis TaxID=252394 RepID=UPI001B7FA151
MIHRVAPLPARGVRRTTAPAENSRRPGQEAADNARPSHRTVPAHTHPVPALADHGRPAPVS